MTEKIKINTNENEYVIPHFPGLKLPVLDYNEVKDKPDVSADLPSFESSNIPPGCRVVGFREVSIKPNDFTLDSSEALLRLTKSESLDTLNQIGAINAATSIDIVPTELDIFDVDPSLRRFEAVHGRDALEIAMRLGPYYPGILENTIHELASTQGTVDEEFDDQLPFRQEEPGKIILLVRDKDDPVAQRFSQEMGWGFPFYGSVDATISYLLAIDQIANDDTTVWDKTYEGRAGTGTLRESFDLASNWLARHLSESPSGFVEFQNKDPRPGHGMDCQSWRDSAYAYIHKDGSRANVKDGIASFDVQVDTFRALKAIARHCDDTEKAGKLLARGEEFRSGVIEEFWVKSDEGGYFALGLDKDPETKTLRQMQVKASSMSAALRDGFLNDENPEDMDKILETVNHLVSPELLAYGGVRTLAKDEVGYHPDNYHTGSVWPWDTAHVADVLDEKGFSYLAWEIRGRMLRTVTETGLFPEFVSGRDDEIVVPNLEVYACIDQDQSVFLLRHPPQKYQGWTISAIFDTKKKAEEFLSRRPAPLAIDGELYNKLRNRNRATNLLNYDSSSLVRAA